MTTHNDKSRRPAPRAASVPSLKPSVPSFAPPAVKAATQSGGQALDRRASAEMSAKFGHDFSSIRIHTDSRAGEAAGAMGANAFALGGDIVFGAGEYQPGSRETDRLLAHELTHVVQQAQFGPGDWGRASGKGDASEQEADSLASQVMMGRSVSVQAAPVAAVARDEDGEGISGMGLSAAPEASSRTLNENGSVDWGNLNPEVTGGTTSAFTSNMGESVSSAPTQALGRAAGGSVGTAPFDPVQDSGLGQPFMAPNLSGLSDLF